MNGEQKLISLAVLVLGLVLVALACTPKQEQQAIGILNAIDRGCVVVQQIHDPEGRVTDACVSVDDVREAVEALLKARAGIPWHCDLHGPEAIRPTLLASSSSSPQQPWWGELDPLSRLAWTLGGVEGLCSGKRG